MSRESVEKGASSRPMINEKLATKTTRNQYYAGLAVSLGGFSAGTVLAWTSPAFQFLIEPDHSRNLTNSTTTAPGFKINTSEEAIISAILMLGGLLAAIPSGRCADKFGRKLTLLLIAILYLGHYILIACSKNVVMLVIGRLFGGIALGGCCVVSPMYIGEIADDSLKAILGSLFSVLLALGVLYTGVLGIFANWWGLSLGLALTSMAGIVALVLLPETPLYLVTAEKFGKAKSSLMFYKKDEKIAMEELQRLQREVAGQEEGARLWSFLTYKRYRKPLLAGLGVFVYQQFCGINVVVFNLVPIFAAAGSNLHPSVAATITNLICLIVGIISVLVVNKRDRKYFLLLSATSMLIGTAGLGLFFHLKSYGISGFGLNALPISCIVLFQAGFAIGLGPVPWILLIELYNPEMRGIASGLNIVSSWMSAFVVTFSYPYLLRLLGSAFTFYLYSGFNLMGILFILCVVPETRQRGKCG